MLYIIHNHFTGIEIRLNDNIRLRQTHRLAHWLTDSRVHMLEYSCKHSLTRTERERQSVSSRNSLKPMTDVVENHRLKLMRAQRKTHYNKSENYPIQPNPINETYSRVNYRHEIDSHGKKCVYGKQQPLTIAHSAYVCMFGLRLSFSSFFAHSICPFVF